jgi:hypothetical protein
LLVADRVVTVTAGAAAAISLGTAHALGAAPDTMADVFIAQVPGIPRAGYFRLLECLAADEVTMEEVRVTQDRYDNHFLDSPAWAEERRPRSCQPSGPDGEGQAAPTARRARGDPGRRPGPLQGAVTAARPAMREGAGGHA